MIERGHFDWDAIAIKAGTTADPAAGAQLATITVPANRRWQFWGIELVLVADAGGADRSFVGQLLIAGGSYTTYQTNAGVAIAATQTKLQSFIAGSLLTTAGTQYGMHIPLIELPAGAKITIYCSNLAAGDNISAATYWYKEAPG